MTSPPAWYGTPGPGSRERMDQLAARPADASFAAALDQPGLAGSVSAVIPTFNRCPFDPQTRMADNPLYWAVASLRAQSGRALAEILIVDDGSDDYTSAVVRHLAREDHPVPVRAVRLAARSGAWHARNTGAAASRSRWLYYADDDCIAAPHAIVGAAYALAKLRHYDPQAAAVMTPCYYRTLRPVAVLPRDRIGMLDIACGDFATGFHAIPADYLNATSPVLGPAGLLAPLPVDLIGGTALIDRAMLGRAGGFADLSAWDSGYSDHLHLSADLAAAGARLYHCPDPRLSAAHLKFGTPGRYPLARHDTGPIVTALARPLAELISLSAAPRTQTGHRLPDALFFPEQIGSFFAFFAARSAAGGRAFAERSWNEFVVHGAVPTLAVTTIPPPPARIAAWRSGLTRGAAFLAAARPSLPRAQVQQILQEVTDACGQPRLTGW